MKLNRSLAISNQIYECKTGNIIGMLENEFPGLSLTADSGTKSRNRVFTVRDTLLTMVLTAIQEDKTLKNSVDLYYVIHQQNKKRVIEELELMLEKEKELDSQSPKKAGRPKKYTVRLPKSLENDISLNTAAFSKARERVPLELIQELFNASRIEQVVNDYSHWNGYRILIGDGTYVQMQDTESLRELYEVKHNGKPSDGYPQGLLEAITERGTGQIHSFALSNRHVSELSLFYNMIPSVPPGCLLLLDDLYNCYEIIAQCQRHNCEMVIPAKRVRNYKVIENIADGDEIIEIKAPKKRSAWLKNDENEKLPALPKTLRLRRLQYKSPDGNEYVLFTTVLDKNIPKDEFQLLYLSRYDIEISIREVKTIMDINIIRSKTPEMALKELTVSLATYNLIRKVVHASIKNLPFSPKEDFIQKFYTINKNILVDKKGRVYNRWSTGRRRAGKAIDQTGLTKTKTQQEI
ncbi:MAG: IS4 family transposase [Bacteroidota bacterium]